jgi:hypothetical protein
LLLSTYFFCLDTKKVTKKSQASNEYSLPKSRDRLLLASSFVELFAHSNSALVILRLALLHPKNKEYFFAYVALIIRFAIKFLILKKHDEYNKKILRN